MAPNPPHPRDHVLCLPAELQAASTDVTKVTVKVRVNDVVYGASPFSSVTTPAVVQDLDRTNEYRLEFAGAAFNDADRVSYGWYYNGVAVPGCAGMVIIGPAGVDGAHFTNARGDKLDELDTILADLVTTLVRLPSDIWDEAASAHTTNGTFGRLMAFLDAAVSSRADGSVWTAALAAVLSALSTRTGTAQAGASGSITLDAGASGLTDFYVGQWVAIASGAGAGQVRLITGYVGSTKVATVHSNWKTQPTGTSVFYLLAAADIQGVVLADTTTTLTSAPPDSAGVTTLVARPAPDNADIVTILADVVTLLTRLPSDVLDELVTGHNTANSVGKLLQYLDALVSSRATPADVNVQVNADLAPLEATVAAIKLKTDLLGSGAATYVSPLARPGRLELVAGADYKAVDGRALVWPWDGAMPTSAQLKIGRLTVSGDVSTPGIVSFDLTATQTSALLPTSAFSVWGILADTSEVRGDHGICTVG